MTKHPETFMPLIHYVIVLIDDILSKVMLDFRQTLLQFIDVVNLMTVAYTSVHTMYPCQRRTF